MSRYIDIEPILEWCDNPEVFEPYGVNSVELKRKIRQAPSIDIVRCKECKHWVYNFNGCARNPCTEPWYATDFCNYGERSEP